MSRGITRIRALLHDPPQKACFLFTHEHWAQELLQRIGAGTPDAATHRADCMAAGADRIELPEKEPTLTLFKSKPEIVHPLSGQTIPLASMEDLHALEVQRVAKAALDALESEVPSSGTEESRYHRLATLLWRKFPEALRSAAGRENLGLLWDWLPADTRVPDHTIWDHQRLTSAFALAGDSPALLLFSISPVQGFIAGGRKLSDLWCASLILSRTIWAAMRSVVDPLGPESILFPDLRGQPVVDHDLELRKVNRENLRVPSLPNRFAALVPAAEADALGRAASSAARARFEEVARKAAESAFGPLEEPVHRRLREQCKSFLEVSWVGLPWPASPQAWKDAASQSGIPADDLARRIETLSRHGFWVPGRGALYGDLYRAAQKVHGGLKAARRFEAPAEPGRKCSACGERQPFPYAEDARPAWMEAIGNDPGLARKNEFLCAVCLARRRGFEAFDLDGRFPSTSSIAAAPWLRAVCEKATPGTPLYAALTAFARAAEPLRHERNARAPWRIYRDFRHDPMIEAFLHVDARLVFDETYETQDFETDIDPEVRETLRRAARDLRKEAGEPSRYFAVLAADGDHMGALLAGAGAPPFTSVMHSSVLDRVGAARNDLADLPRPTSPAWHATISRILRDFSLKVAPDLVEQAHDGELVYAGGDDLLALASPAESLRIAAEIRRAWSGDPECRSGEWTFSKGYGLKGKQLCLAMGPGQTLSAGIAIAHYKAPLTETLAAARHALHEAKERGRDALGLALLKRSGEHSTQVLSWSGGPGTLLRLTELFRDSSLSPRVLAALRRFEPPPGVPPFDGAFGDLLRKHFLDHGARGKESMVQEAADEIATLGKQEGFRPGDWKSLLSFVGAAAFLARGGNP
jgi:CRISPR-associated protein Cmr2